MTSISRYKSNGIAVCTIPSDVFHDTTQEILLDNVSCSSNNFKPKSSNRFTLVDLPFGDISDSNILRKRKREGLKASSTFDTKRKKSNDETDVLIEKFHNLTSKGPEYVCTSCCQIFFRHSVIIMKTKNFKACLIKDCVKGIKSVSGMEYICYQCNNYLKNSEVPPCSIGNNMSFPDVPDELKNLTQLEQLLISPRIPFMKIRELPRGGQLGIKGNVVNVPADVNKTVRLIPRNMSESETIPVKFKRSLNFKSHLAFEQVRPEKILKAAKWLVNHSNLFQNEGISVNEDWMVESQFENPFVQENEHNFCDENNETFPQSDIEGDQNNELEAGNLDTLLHPADFREFNRILSLAPAEGNITLSMFQDKFSEFLCFPGLYCGQPREDNNKRITPVHYSTICKWELRNVDRRVAQNVTNIFYKLKRVQIKQITDKVTLAMRKCKLKGKKVTVGEMLSNDSVNKILKLDQGYKILRTLRGSPPY